MDGKTAAGSREGAPGVVQFPAEGSAGTHSHPGLSARQENRSPPSPHPQVGMT